MNNIFTDIENNGNESQLMSPLALPPSLPQSQIIDIFTECKNISDEAINSIPSNIIDSVSNAMSLVQTISQLSFNDRTILFAKYKDDKYYKILLSQLYLIADIIDIDGEVLIE